jgi:hypothetical protein
MFDTSTFAPNYVYLGVVKGYISGGCLGVRSGMPGHTVHGLGAAAEGIATTMTHGIEQE